MDPGAAPGPRPFRRPPTDAPDAAPPSIGVPAIPASSDRSRPPRVVPDAPAGARPPADPAAVPGILVAAEAPGQRTRPPGDGGDGEAGFEPAVAAALGRYVYLLVDPRTGRAFSVGRGRGDRCFRHVRAARDGETTDPGAADPGGGGHRRRPFPHLDRIREVEAAGGRVRIDILRHGLSGPEAALVAEAVADALGVSPAPGSEPRRRTADEIRSLLAEPVRIKRTHPVVLLRVGPAGADTTYEGVRHGWRIGRRWTDLGSARSPRWVLVVAGDLVAAVYRIGAWEPTPAAGAAGWDGPPAPEHFSFAGTVDHHLGARYVGRSVAGYLRPGAPGAVTFVWSGPRSVDPDP